METLEEKVKRVLAESIEVVPYDAAWPAMYESQKAHLLACLPSGLIKRIEHFGSTAVVGLAAKPVVDMLVEVGDVELARRVVPEVLEPQGYDCFWRPTIGNDTPPWYTWCIARDGSGHRTHHIHVGEVGFKQQELRFRDLLRADAELAARYGRLKMHLASQHAHDREAYTRAKTDFILEALNE